MSFNTVGRRTPRVKRSVLLLVGIPVQLSGSHRLDEAGIRPLFPGSLHRFCWERMSLPRTFQGNGNVTRIIRVGILPKTIINLLIKGGALACPLRRVRVRIWMSCHPSFLRNWNTSGWCQCGGLPNISHPLLREDESTAGSTPLRPKSAGPPWR